MRKKILLKDIAREVGVSTTLVSYVMNGKFINRINPTTAKRIKEVAKKMNYRPNQIAKSLKNNTTHTIGLIVSDIANPFSSTLARIIEDEAKKRAFTVIFGSADENVQKAESLINALLSRQVDGIIMAPPAEFKQYIIQLQNEKVPVVLVDRFFDDLEVNQVTIDNYDAVYQAVKHLVENGFKNIGFVNYQSKLVHLRERTRGYIEAIHDSRLKFVQENLVLIDESNISEEVVDSLDRLINKESPVDALFFSSSKVALEGLAYLSRIKVKVPDDIGVICFDEMKAYDLFPYPVSYIKQPMEEIGKTAIRLLFKAMLNEHQIEKKVLKTSVVKKESSLKK